MATTTTTTLTNTIKTYYDRVLIEALDPTLIFYQFGQKKPLPKGEGTSVRWNRPTRLATGYNLGEASAPALLSTGNALSTTAVSGVIQTYGGFTVITELVNLTSITDVMKMAAERLGAQAGETIERIITSEMVAHAATLGNSSHHVYKTSTDVWDYWGSVSGVSVVAVPGGPLATVSAANVLAVSDIRSAIYTLKRLNVKPYDGNDYMSIINTETAEDIVGDSDWISFHQYVEKGVENIYRGEIGKIYGCRFVETTQGPVTRGSNVNGVASSLAYGTLIFGKGFYGVTELDGGIRTYITQGASKYDPLNQVTTYGWKAKFATKILHASAGLTLWAGSNDTTVAATQSAGSGTRFEAVTSY